MTISDEILRDGRTAANLASMKPICRRHEIDPKLYLTQLLVNFPSWPAHDLDAWLTDQWKLRQAARLATLQDTSITESWDVWFRYRSHYSPVVRLASLY